MIAVIIVPILFLLKLVAEANVKSANNEKENDGSGENQVVHMTNK
jgi:hypothetical protein